MDLVDQAEADKSRELVTKANDLVEATFRLSLVEQRLIALAISQLDSRKSIPRPLKVTAVDFARTYDLPLNQAYEALKDAAENLFERKLQTYRDGKLTDQFRWTDRSKYHEGEGYVDMWFTSHIEPFLTLLQGSFTSYRMWRISRLSSTHTFRIFELLMRWIDTGYYIVPLDRFKEMLHLTGPGYARFGNIRARVLDKAIEEIEEKAFIKVTYKALKTNKTIDRIEFRFFDMKPEPKGKIMALDVLAEKRESPAKLTKSYVAKHAYPGETWDEAFARLSRKPAENQ